MGRIAGVTPEETRARLVDAAARVFAQQGYEGARVSHIAKVAGLSTGAIYAHYRTKAELLADAIRLRGGDELAALLAATGGPASLPALLEGLGTALAAPRRRRRGLLVEAVVAARRDPDVARLLHDGVARQEGLFAEVIADAQAAGVLDATLPAAAVARLCLTLALGALVVEALDLDPPDPDGWAGTIARLVAAVRAPHEPTRT